MTLAVREFFWPILEPCTPAQEQSQADSLAADKAAIQALNLANDPEVAIEEARRMADAESERRKIADQKATTYLVVVAALIPLILTLATAIWDRKAGSAPTWVNMLLLAIAVLYIAGAGLWAFRVLEVAASNRIGVADVSDAWKQSDPSHALTRKTMWCARSNHRGVNQKVSSIKMAHAFLLRAFFCFAILLLFNILWYFGTVVWPRERSGDPWMASARHAVLANIRLSELERNLTTDPAWLLLVQRCRTQPPSNQSPLSVTPVVERNQAVPAQIRLLLRAESNEQIRYRRLRVRCRGTEIGSLRIWELPTRQSAQQPVSSTTGSVTLGPPFDVEGVVAVPLRVERLWPPRDPMRLTAVLPNELIRQQVLLCETGGRPVAYVESRLERGILGTPPR